VEISPMNMKEFYSFFLPPNTLEYFDMRDMKVKEGKEKYMGKYSFDDEYTIVLVEKERLPEDRGKHEGKRLRTKGYTDILLEDFPLRGRKTTLQYRIRKWQVEGEKGTFQRKIEIKTEGVKYTGEFAFFFEEGDRE
jgi:transposase